MPIEANNVPVPAEPISDEQAKQDELNFRRLWDDGGANAEPVAFDPAIHQPPLTAEELAELDGEDKN